MIYYLHRKFPAYSFIVQGEGKKRSIQKITRHRNFFASSVVVLDGDDLALNWVFPECDPRNHAHEDLTEMTHHENVIYLDPEVKNDKYTQDLIRSMNSWSFPDNHGEFMD